MTHNYLTPGFKSLSAERLTVSIIRLLAHLVIEMLSILA